MCTYVCILQKYVYPKPVNCSFLPTQHNNFTINRPTMSFNCVYYYYRIHRKLFDHISSHYIASHSTPTILKRCPNIFCTFSLYVCAYKTDMHVKIAATLFKNYPHHSMPAILLLLLLVYMYMDATDACLCVQRIVTRKDIHNIYSIYIFCRRHRYTNKTYIHTHPNIHIEILTFISRGYKLSIPYTYTCR